MTSSTTPDNFGTLPSGERVQAWTLQNRHGLQLEVLNWGGMINRLLVPDAEGRCRDIVLGFSSLDAFYPNAPYFGAIAGRIAGRVPGGQLEIEGQAVQLPLNEGPNHLHGGKDSISHRIWEVEPIAWDGADAALALTLHSPHEDNGYPGAVTLRAIYALTPDNELIFVTEARTDRVTPVSLTQHAYFNLAGEGNGTVLDHELQIASDAVIPVGNNFTPQGYLASTDGKAEDFRTAARIGDRIETMPVPHGDMYWLGESDARRSVAHVACPRSGITMEVSTDETCLQLYIAMHLNGTLVGKSDQPYPAHAAFCMECQGYPGATTAQDLGDILVYPDQPKRQETRYKFSTLSP